VYGCQSNENFYSKWLCIFGVFFASNFQVQGATVITIGGPRDVCKNATTSYTVEATNAKGAIIEISGGGSFVISSISLAGSNCPSVAVFEDSPAATSALFEIQDAGLNTCTKLVATFNVSWGTSGGTLSVLAVKSNNGTTTKSIDIDAEPTPIITGPSGEICSSTSSVNYYVSQVPALQTVTWTTTSTFGAPITPSTTTGIYATFSGLSSGNMYSINAQYQCSGSPVKSTGLFIITGLSCRIAPPSRELKTGNLSVTSFDSPESQLSLTNDLKVYPNPATLNSVLVVELPQEYIAQLPVTAKVFNSQGQLLRTIKTDKNKFSFETKQLDAGSYYLTLTMGDKKETKRFVIVE